MKKDPQRLSSDEIKRKNFANNLMHLNNGPIKVTYFSRILERLMLILLILNFRDIAADMSV